MPFYGTPLLGMIINTTSQNLQMYSKCVICSLATVHFEATDVKMVFVKYVHFNVKFLFKQVF